MPACGGSLNSFKAKLVSLDSVLWRHTAVGLETCAASLECSWEFVFIIKLQDTLYHC